MKRGNASLNLRRSLVASLSFSSLLRTISILTTSAVLYYFGEGTCLLKLSNDLAWWCDLRSFSSDCLPLPESDCRDGLFCSVLGEVRVVIPMKLRLFYSFRTEVFGIFVGWCEANVDMTKFDFSECILTIIFFSLFG